jgi:hypothetical protein
MINLNMALLSLYNTQNFIESLPLIPHIVLPRHMTLLVKHWNSHTFCRYLENWSPESDSLRLHRGI